MSGSNPCTFLEWDSNFFGLRIARLEGNRLNAELMQRADDWCRKEKIECLYVLADSMDSNTVVCTEQWKAHFADTRVTLRTYSGERPQIFSPLQRGSAAEGGEGVAHTTTQHEIRPCNDRDMAALRSIARTSHSDSRFFFDPRFTRSQCESLYEHWITRSHEGFADTVLVAELQGKAVGYATCHLDRESRAGKIGLFAIDKEVRGLGIGQSLATGALRWFAERQVDHADVVTQGRNVDVQRLYAKCGFRIHSVFLWYHKWF